MGGALINNPSAFPKLVASWWMGLQSPWAQANHGYWLCGLEDIKLGGQEMGSAVLGTKVEWRIRNKYIVGF